MVRAQLYDYSILKDFCSSSDAIMPSLWYKRLQSFAMGALPYRITCGFGYACTLATFCPGSTD
jgi:hypothetical protein